MRRRQEGSRVYQFRRIYINAQGKFTIESGDVRPALAGETDEVALLFDRFLDGRGFIPKGIIHNLIDKQTYVYLIRYGGDIVAVAIGRRGGTLWNLLVHPDFRSKGLGEALVRFIDPEKIRVKWTAKRPISDPTGFYERLGYRFAEYVVPRNVWAAGKYRKTGDQATIKIMRKKEG